MPAQPLAVITDALAAAQDRGMLPTTLDSAGLKELGAEVLAKSVFTARGADAVFVSQLKEVIDQLPAGDIGEGQARTALWETLKAIGYTPEGGFPSTPLGQVPEAMAGTLQDLSSRRRLDLIVRTQKDLMTGAGQQIRGMIPAFLAMFPAWELVRMGPVRVARDWPLRWAEAGGKDPGDEFPAFSYQTVGAPTGMIAFKGDPVWGELGSSGNFDDALDVDYPPFCYNSGMGWRPRSRAYCQLHDVTGPDGESIDEWQASQPNILGGKLPLPAPQVSLAGVDPAIAERFRLATQGTTDPGKPMVVNYSDILAKALAAAKAAYHP